MTPKEFFNHFNNQEAGYHLLSFGAQSKYQGNKRTLNLDWFSCIDSTGVDPNILGDIDFPASSRKVYSDSRRLKFSIGICTNTKNSCRSEVMIFHPDNESIDVMTELADSNTSYYALMFKGRDNTTGEDMLGFLYCNIDNNSPHLQFVITSEEAFQNLLAELYNHIVNETIKFSEMNLFLPKYNFSCIQEGEVNLNGR